MREFSSLLRSIRRQLLLSVILKMVYNLRMFVGTYKNKKKKIEKTIGSKRSRVGTNRR